MLGQKGKIMTNKTTLFEILFFCNIIYRFSFAVFIFIRSNWIWVGIFLWHPSIENSICMLFLCLLLFFIISFQCLWQFNFAHSKFSVDGVVLFVAFAAEMRALARFHVQRNIYRAVGNFFEWFTLSFLHFLVVLKYIQNYLHIKIMS